MLQAEDFVANHEFKVLGWVGDDIALARRLARDDKVAINAKGKDPSLQAMKEQGAIHVTILANRIKSIVHSISQPVMYFIFCIVLSTS